jgi:hypothetical protein
MVESRNYVKYPKLGNPLLIETWKNNGKFKLLEAMKTQDIYVIMYIMKFT